MNSVTTRCALLFALMLSFANSSPAAITTFAGLDNNKSLTPTLPNANAARNSFLATLPSYGVDNLESFSHVAATPSPVTLNFFPLGTTAVAQFNAINTFSLYATSGTNFLYDAAGGPASPPVDDILTFAQPVSAFGVFMANFADNSNPNTITWVLDLNGTEVATLVLGTFSRALDGGISTGLAQGNGVYFFGVSGDQPFNRITFKETFDYDGLLYDDFTAGPTTIPEPSTYAGLLLAGSTAFWLLKRRR